MADECDGPFTKEDYNRLLYNVAASNNETWALRHDPRGDFLVEIYVAARVAFNKLCQTGEWDHYGAPPQVIYALWGGLKEHYGEETSNRLLVPMKAAWKREGWEWDDWKKETENPFTKKYSGWMPPDYKGEVVNG